jgi:hypothetical protein
MYVWVVLLKVDDVRPRLIPFFAFWVMAGGGWMDLCRDRQVVTIFVNLRLSLVSN